MAFLRICLAAARCFVCSRALGIASSVFQVLAVQSMARFAVLLPLTPGRPGVRGAMIGSSGHVLGLPAEMAVLAALVQRGVGIIVIFALGSVFSSVVPPGLRPSRESANLERT